MFYGSGPESAPVNNTLPENYSKFKFKFKFAVPFSHKQALSVDFNMNKNTKKDMFIALCKCQNGATRCHNWIFSPIFLLRLKT